jgi:hypothetical protein
LLTILKTTLIFSSTLLPNRRLILFHFNLLKESEENFTSVLFCASIFFYAQTGSLSGNINDDAKIALPGAKISLSPGNIYTTSDEHGNLYF